MSISGYSLFRQSLQDLVKGIRAHRRNESEYVQSKLVEIQEECRRGDPTVKASAVLKVTYLHMCGCSVSSSTFHVVEVLSRREFVHKRVGYLAAAQIFSPTTDVLLLCTNQFKKDLTSGRVECSQALTCIAKIVTEELGRECSKDVMSLLNSARPYIRKKAILTVYKVGLVCPEIVGAFLPRLRERLDDSDTSVVCAAVTVICEMAKKDPKLFLGFAPVLYSLLERDTINNWTQIKIVKLMGTLTPLEPRLSKKLRDPLRKLMSLTKAKSLLYECCNTVTIGLDMYSDVIELCAGKLGEFICGKDQNLKFLGLLAMKRVARIQPELVNEHRDVILNCLDDQDVVIRMRSLDLVAQFISKRNLREISKLLLGKLQKERSVSSDFESHYRDSVAERLLVAGEFVRSGEKSSYPHLTTSSDFDWYINTVLFGLLGTPDLSPGILDSVSAQLLEMTARVAACRPPTVSSSMQFLRHLISSRRIETDKMSRILSAPVFVIGEYASHLGDPLDALQVLCSFPQDAMRAVETSRLLCAVLKVFARVPEDSASLTLLHKWLKSLALNYEADIQEVALLVQKLTGMEDSKEALLHLFATELKPVDPRAQSKVKCPADLNLEEGIYEVSDMEEIDAFDAEDHETEELGWNGDSNYASLSLSRSGDVSQVDRTSGPFYLSEKKSSQRREESVTYGTVAEQPAIDIFFGKDSPTRQGDQILLVDDLIPDGAQFSEDDESKAAAVKPAGKVMVTKGKAKKEGGKRTRRGKREKTRTVPSTSTLTVPALTVDDLLG